MVDSPNVETARAMMRAHRERRLDEMLEYLHPDVRWRPMFRPGQSLCVGRDGVRQLVDDITAALGPYWFDLDEVFDDGSGCVTVRADLVLASGERAGVDEGVEFNMSFVDGLVHDVVTLPSAPGALRRWDGHAFSGVTVTTVRLGSVVIVVLGGELSASSQGAVLEAVREAIASDRQLIQLECYGIDAVGPGAVEVLTDAVDAARGAGVHVQVLRPSAALRELIGSGIDAGLDVLE